MPFWLIPIVVMGALLLLVALLIGVTYVLSRFRKGRYLRAIVGFLSKVPFMRRWFQRMSQVAIERQNPELASAMRKLQRLGPAPDPQKVQQAFSQLTASERRAYLAAADAQGDVPEAANRQMRRLQKRMQAGGGPSMRPTQQKRKNR
jgi:hypothetical protein